ncbi:MAG: XdhC family protein, partial [Motiliproteus sp.]|nr:XdhC family protein [Motiliproteus sp.]
AASESSRPVLTKPQVVEEGDQQWLLTPVVPDPHLLVVGGGLDARPLVSMAHQQGWQVSLWDPRPANARREFFLDADFILNCEVTELHQYCLDRSVNGAVLMAHNVGMDAAALKSLQGVELEYLAMLGPSNRQQRVLTQAGLTAAELTVPVAGPAGLDLGAELPEGIALSILAEFHAAIKGRKGGSLSGVVW